MEKIHTMQNQDINYFKKIRNQCMKLSQTCQLKGEVSTQYYLEQFKVGKERNRTLIYIIYFGLLIVIEIRAS